MSCDKVH